MILPATRRALELLVQAGGELVLLGPGWHELTADRGRLQYVEGPCWVPPDRGPGRRPAVIESVSCEGAEELIRLGWATTIGVRPAGVRLLILPDGERAAEGGQP